MGKLRAFAPTVTTVQRLALGLVVLTLLAGCGDSSSPVATPTPIAQAPANTPTMTLPTAAPLEPTPTEITSATATTDSPASGAGGAGSPTIHWRNGDWFLLGVNYAYHKYGNDFGGNDWGSYGVHDPKTYADVDADFAKMSSLGIRIARWFVFADGRAGITYDAAGLPSGLDESVFKDFDAALEIAQRHNIGLDLVLLDYRFLWDANIDNGVQLGGHASVLASPDGQKALLHNVFEPVFQRYANHPAILSWEVMNEPEWALGDAGQVDRQNISQPLSLATFRTFAQMTVDAIHSEARSYATLGCADPKWAQNWVGLGLDYYQIHYYDWMKPYSTDNLYVMNAESLHLDRPVVVGEFPADHSAVAGLSNYLDTWQKNGYAGAWPWSFGGDTTWGSPDPVVLRTWADAHKQAVDIPSAP